MNAASAGESWRRPALAHIEIQGDRYPAHLAARAGRCTSQDLVTMHDVAHVQIDKIAAAQLTVDRQVEHGQVSNLMGVLKLNSDCPDVLRLQRWFLADQLAFVPGSPVLSGFHDRLLRR
jgi:hypothetical protein